MRSVRHVTIIICGTIFALSVVTAGESASAAPRMRIDGGKIAGMRICSPRYLLAIPVANIGDSPLVIRTLRGTCPGCSKTAITRDEIPPGQSADIRVLGSQKKKGKFTVGLFIASNDPGQPEKKLDLQLEYDPLYSVHVYWEGSANRVLCPLDDPYRLEPRSVRRSRKLVLDIAALVPAIKIDHVSVESEHFQEGSCRMTDGDAIVELVNTLDKPGIYHDWLQVTLNRTDLVLVPLQIVLLDSFRILDDSISFSYVREGEVVFRQVRILFDNPDLVWKQYHIEPPKGMEKAFAIANVEKAASGEVLIDLKIDTRFLGGPGMKRIPLSIVGGTKKRVHFVVYGQVY